jgi:fatty-acyl-CoA synthase
VESLLRSNPKVKDVAVIGVPDPKWGERVHAVVILRDGALASDADLSAWCRDRVAGYKRPRSFSFLREEEVPRTATGKIQHRLLKVKLSGGQGG